MPERKTLKNLFTIHIFAFEDASEELLDLRHVLTAVLPPGGSALCSTIDLNLLPLPSAPLGTKSLAVTARLFFSMLSS